jgi:hypothetical protein
MDSLTLIALGIFSRLVPHVPNVTAVGANAIFASSKLSLKKSLAITLLTLFVSDAIIGFHPVMWATYGSFALYAVLGSFLQKHANWKRITAAVLLSSFQFFVITNFAVWMTGILYPKTLDGLARCYLMALPFFRNTLIGDGIASVVLFGLSYVFERVLQKNVAPQKNLVGAITYK